jgi:Mn2+/Fe2+ NRAMP family transporter
LSPKDATASARKVAPDDSLVAKLGPGLITGAADDDPSGIATYAQGGAQFGYGLLWTLFLTYPLMVGIQIVSARIGRVSGLGLAGNIRRHYPAWLLYGLVSLLVVANTINIGADLSAMADATALVVGGSRGLYMVSFGLFCILLQVFFSYASYVRVLKWLTLSLFAYVAVVFAIELPWLDVLKGALIPSLRMSPGYMTAVVAILGTTISPYLFFWQASQECEELRAVKADKPLHDHPEQAARQLARIRIDTYVGMAFSNLIAFFIMLTAAATLHAHGVTGHRKLGTGGEALRPIAGQFAFSSSAWASSAPASWPCPCSRVGGFRSRESFRWRRGLDLPPLRGARFYGVIAVATLLGVGLGSRISIRSRRCSMPRSSTV